MMMVSKGFSKVVICVCRLLQTMGHPQNNYNYVSRRGVRRSKNGSTAKEFSSRHDFCTRTGSRSVTLPSLGFAPPNAKGCLELDRFFL